MKSKIKKRDYNIQLHSKGEINLGTKVQGKSKYSRKIKHKSEFYWSPERKSNDENRSNSKQKIQSWK